MDLCLQIIHENSVRHETIKNLQKQLKTMFSAKYFTYSPDITLQWKGINLLVYFVMFVVYVIHLGLLPTEC